MSLPLHSPTQECTACDLKSDEPSPSSLPAQQTVGNANMKIKTHAHLQQDKQADTAQQVPDESVHAFDASHSKIHRIACIGAGHVGGPTSAVLAYMNPNIDITVVDRDSERIKAWNSAILPIYEPDLDNIVITARDGHSMDDSMTGPQYSTAQYGAVSPSAGEIATSENAHHKKHSPATIGLTRRPNLFFSTDVEKAVADADLVFICVNTPPKGDGSWTGSAFDLKDIEVATRMIATVSRSNKIVVEKSTVPCRTADSIRCILEANAHPGVQFEILSNPEFLAEGTAVSDLRSPDRILIGSLPTTTGYRAAASLAEIYAGWVPLDRIITMNIWSSELSKLAANALLAQRISSINALSAICEGTGADIDEVAYACGLDSRIGPRMLKAGPGFGGSCFQKDVLSLVYLSQSLHLPEVAEYWRSIITINDHQKARFVKRITHAMFNNLTNKKIAVLGFAYKKDTGDTRQSASIDLVLALADESAEVTIYDPVVEEKQIWTALEEKSQFGRRIKRVRVCQGAYECCLDADAVVIMTDWEEFSNMGCIAQSTPATEGPPMLLDPDRVGVSQLATSASTASIRSLSGKLERVLFSGQDGIATPTVNAPPRRSSSVTDDRATRRRTQASYDEHFEESHVEYDSHHIQRLDWDRIACGMRRPKYVFDGRNIMDVAKLEKLGFQVEAIGKSSKTLRS